MRITFSSPGSGILFIKRFLIVILGFSFFLTILKQGVYIPEFQFPLERKTIKESPSIRNTISKEPDTDTLIDLQGFKFLKHNRDFCTLPSKGSKNLLLILIHSSPHNLVYRDLVRRTWASLSTIGDWNIKYAFLIGKYVETSDTPASTGLEVDLIDMEIGELIRAVEQESIERDDLIIGNFIDIYKHLTYKQIMGYKWALRYCPQAKFVLKTDSDVFTDVFQVIETVNGLKSTNMIACSIIPETHPARNPEDKVAVPKEEYSADVFPPYCMGMGYLVSFDLLKDLVKASEQVPYLRLEDLYVTGILREYVQKRFGRIVNFVNLQNNTFNEGNEFVEWLYRSKFTREVEVRLPWMFIHNIGDEIVVHFEQLWKLVLKLNNMESEIKPSR